MSILDSGVNHETPNGSPTRIRSRAIGLLAATGIVLVAIGVSVPYLTPFVGMLFVFGVPVYILLTTTEWHGIPSRERVVLSLSATIVMVLVVGLLINEILPLVGVGRPLDRVPVAISFGAAWSLLWWRRRARWSPLLPSLRSVTVGWRDGGLVALAVSALVMSVVGATRLNNNAGSGAAVLTQALVVFLLAATLVLRGRLSEGTTAIVVYASGLALLFQESLRGWFVSGSDIQHEYFVFTQTVKAGHWSLNNVQDAYNSCLSITLLPTIILRFTGLDGPYVYKVCFQLLFAFAGVIVYSIAARLMSSRLALVSVIFFISFPTFYTDMPFLNRQEIAFLCCGCCFLLFLVEEIPLHRRRVWLIALLLATVVTHYSTAYLLLGVLAIAKFCELGSRRQVDRRHGRLPRSPVTLPCLIIAAGLSIAWGSGPAHLDRQAESTLSSIVSALNGSSGSSRSSATAYGLFGEKTPSATVLLRDYVNSTLPRAPAARAAAKRVATAYPASLAPTSQLAPTRLGNALDKAGLDVASLNTLVRSWSAKLLELLVFAGLIAAAGAARLGRSKRIAVIPSGLRLDTDFYFVAFGSALIVALQVVLPVISVDYGLLRAFQEALFVLAPVVTLGCVSVISFVGQKTAVVVAAALALLLLTSLTGLMPQVLGGYPPQLTLNNSGDYYDWFYVSSQEVAAAKWLGTHAPSDSTISADAFSEEILTNYLNLSYSGDIYPTLLLNRGAYVFLDYEQVQLGQATVGESSGLLTYDYPTSFLGTTRDLVYASPDYRIYR